MAQTTTLKVNLNLSGRATADGGSNSATRALAVATTLASGTGAGQADLAFVDTRQLAASGTEDLDLAGSLGGLLGGTTAVFARVKAVVGEDDDGNTNNVLVSRPAAAGAPFFSAAGDQIIVRPGGCLVLACGEADATGYVVTATSADLLTITNSAGSTTVDYTIAVVGCSA